MKAREYAAMFERLKREKTPIQAAEEVTEAFIKETVKIAKQRKAMSDWAFYAVLEEQSDKWKAFARLTGVREVGFEMVIAVAFPDIFKGWMRYRNTIKNKLYMMVK